MPETRAYTPAEVLAAEEIARESINDYTDADVARIIDQRRTHGVHGEWCRSPEACWHRGYCPRDPTCAD